MERRGEGAPRADFLHPVVAECGDQPHRHGQAPASEQHAGACLLHRAAQGEFRRAPLLQQTHDAAIDKVNREDLERQVRRAARPPLSQHLSEPVVYQPHELERQGDAGDEEQDPDDGKVGRPAQPVCSRLLVGS